MTRLTNVLEIIWIFVVGLALAPCHVQGAPQAAALQSIPFQFLGY
jgi:uncharacterized membrane protein YccF (DUF307 family)